MKALFGLLAFVVGGCATTGQSPVPRDYITSLRVPVTCEAYLIPLHSTFGGLRLVDSAGHRVTVYRDFGAGEHGDLILADFRQGRRVDYAGDEGAMLLEIFERLEPDVGRLSGVIRDFAFSIRERRKGPNQTPEPTPTAVTPRADARVAPAAVVAHL